MSLHKLLERQINKWANQEWTKHQDWSKFVAIISEAYFAFDKDRELSNHAFLVSDTEYREINETLRKEYDLKKQSIDKLKKALSKIVDSKDLSIESDDLLVVAEYISVQINRRKEVEKDLSKTANLLTILVQNLNSGIVMEDENRKIVYTNQVFCDMFQISIPPEIMSGMDAAIALEESKDIFLHKKDFIEYTKSKLQQNKLDTEGELELKDGRFLECHYIPIIINGQKRGCVWKYTDISDRKYNELIVQEQSRELKRLSLVASANRNGVLFTDDKGVIFWSNDGFSELTGYAQHETYGMTPIELGKGPETNKNTLDEMILAYNSRQEFLIEVKMYRKDKSWFWARVKGQPIDRNLYDGKVSYFSIIEDITTYKIQEEQIQQLSLVAQANTKGVFILDEKLNFLWLNKSFEDLTGLNIEKLNKKRPTHLISSRTESDEVKQILDDALLSENNTTLEFKILRNKQQDFWARLNLQFVRDNSEQVIHRFGVLEDITREKEAEQALKQSESKYRGIIANMNLGLLEVDLEDKIQYANNSFLKMSGYSLSELIGQPAATLFTDGKNKELILSRKSKRLKGEGDAYEVPVRNKKGEPRWWLISGASRYNNKGEIVGTIGIHLDITQQKLQEEDLRIARIQAEESSRIKAAFLTNMSHEIRTPLNAITGMLRELGKTALISNQKDLIHNADVASKHLMAILNNILDISKIEAGEFDLEEINFNLKELIQECVDIIESQAKEKNLFLQVEWDPQLMDYYLGDPARMRQILLNILGNAVKFTSEGGIQLECRLSATHAGVHEIAFTVIDSGIGMDKAYLRNLYNKFSQEDKSTARKYGGTGLGMAITYELVQLMKGDIKVKSSKNIGTSVYINIPFEPGTKHETVSHDTVTNREILFGKRVLLVEDNEWNRLVANHSMNTFNMRVTEAFNGQEAVKKAAEAEFDIILMDVQMPIMDGFEATGIIRKELKLKTPIIALTANAFKKETDQCLAVGMDDFIIKPYDEQVFFDMLTKYISIGLEEKNAPLFDLSELETLSRGDFGFMLKMLQIFLEQLPKSIEILTAAIGQKDLIEIKRIVHKVKPSLGNIGVRIIQPLILQVEQDEYADGEDVYQVATRILELLNQLNSELDKEFTKLNSSYSNQSSN